MAKLRPIELSEEVLNDPFRQSEVRFFEACKSLPDTWTVLHGVTWYNSQSEGEADFVIVSPDTGIVIVEVKGGGIGRDEKGWYSINRNEEKHYIRDPYLQAKNCKYNLLKFLKGYSCFKDRHLPARHMICFPNVLRRNSIDLIDLPRETQILFEDLTDLQSSILNFAKRKYDNIHRQLSNEDCLKIVEILKPNFDIPNNESLQTANQISFLDVNASNPQILGTDLGTDEKLYEEQAEVFNDFDIHGNCLMKYLGTSAEVVIPNGITGIAGNSFKNCAHLTSVMIPNSVTDIGPSAFENCTNLTSIVLPESITYIGSHAFENCTSLTNITIPKSVTELGSGVFKGCTKLIIYCESTRKSFYNSVHWDLSWKGPCRVIWGTTAETFNGFEIDDGCLIKYIGNNNEIIIPNNVTKIESNAFIGGNWGVTSITIPDSVTIIDRSAFTPCIFLEKVIFETPYGWECSLSPDAKNGIPIEGLFDENTALKQIITYYKYYWRRN